MENKEKPAFYVMEVDNANDWREPEKFYAMNWLSAKKAAVRSHKVYCGTVLYLNDHLDKDGNFTKKGSLFRGKDGKWVETE